MRPCTDQFYLLRLIQFIVINHINTMCPSVSKCSKAGLLWDLVEFLFLKRVLRPFSRPEFCSQVCLSNRNIDIIGPWITTYFPWSPLLAKRIPCKETCILTLTPGLYGENCFIDRWLESLTQKTRFEICRHSSTIRHATLLIFCIWIPLCSQPSISTMIGNFNRANHF